MRHRRNAKRDSRDTSQSKLHNVLIGFVDAMAKVFHNLTGKFQKGRTRNKLLQAVSLLQNVKPKEQLPPDKKAEENYGFEQARSYEQRKLGELERQMIRTPQGKTGRRL